MIFSPAVKFNRGGKFFRSERFMTYDTNIIIKTDSETKNETQEIFEALGLDINTAVNIFLRQTIIHHGMPFKIVLEPNDTTFLYTA